VADRCFRSGLPVGPLSRAKPPHGAVQPHGGAFPCAAPWGGFARDHWALGTVGGESPHSGFFGYRAVRLAPVDDHVADQEVVAAGSPLDDDGVGALLQDAALNHAYSPSFPIEIPPFV
jgi:hypothetical protein